MRGITRTLGALFAASALAAPVWAAADITGLEPWACYEFNGSDANTGSGGRGWNDGSISYTVGASGKANTAASITKWTAVGNVSTTGGLTVSLLATEGATHSTVDNNGHLFSLAADNNAGAPQWWLRNTGTTGQLKLQGVFTEDLVITLPSDSTDTTFHHYVIAISGDRTSAAVYVDGVAVDTTGKTVNATDAGTGVNANFYGYQVGARWGGGTGSGCVIDDLRIYTATLTAEQVSALYTLHFPETTEISRTVSGADGLWSTTTAWSPEGLPGKNGAVTITATDNATLTLDAQAEIYDLTVTGAGSLTLAAPTSAETASSLTAASATIEADTDVSAVTASLGIVEVKANKTLTLSSLGQISGSAGSGTVTLKGTSEISDKSKLGAGVALNIVSGTVTYSGDGTENGLAKGRVISVIGSDSKLTLTNGDATGWGYTAGQKIVLQDGGTLITQLRETMITPLELCGGHLQLTAAHSSRAIDFYNGTASVTDLTVTAKDGETGETLSTLTSTGSDEAAQTALIRQAPGDSNNTFSIDVADKARLRVDTILASSATYNNGGGDQTETGTAPLEKKGDGVLELTRVNTYATGTTITGGKVLLSGAGTVGTGAVSIATGATLEVGFPEADGADKTLSAVSGSGALLVNGAGTVKSSDVSAYTGTATVTAGTLDLHGATFGETLPTFAVESGATLILPAGTEGTIAVPDGATLTLVLSSTQLLSGYTTTVTSGTVSFKKVADDGTLAEISESEGSVSNGTFTPSLNTWTASTAEDDGSYTWSNLANWSKGAVPEAGDSVWISASGETTLTLTAAATVAQVIVKGAGTVTIAGEKLTVSEKLLVDSASLVATDATLAYGKVQIEQGQTVTMTLSGETKYNSGFISGEGTFIKQGSTTLQLIASTQRAVVDGATVQIEAGELECSLGSAGDALLSNATLVFKKNATWTSYGWTHIDGTVTIDVPEADATIDFTHRSDNATNGTSLGGTGSLVKKGAGTLVLPLKGDNSPYTGTTTIEAGVLGLRCNGNGSGITTGTFPSVISGEGKVEILDGTITLSGANTYNGGTDIASGATLQASGIGNLGTGGVSVNENATLKLTSTANVSEADANYSAVTGTGTIHFSGSGYRTLPIGESAMFDSALALCNEQSAALVITRANAVTTVGSLSGSGAFRVDWGTGERTLKILQAKNTTYSGDMIYNASTDRLVKVVVAGAEAASEKTLTLSGSTTIAKLLEVEDTGSVNLTGSWAGAVTVAGKLAGTGTVSGTLTFNSGATLDVTAGALTAGTVSIADDVTVAVTLPESAAAGTTVLTCSSPATVAEKLTGAPDGLKFAANSEGTAVVLATAIVIPPVAEESGDVTLSAESQATLLAAAEAAGLSEVTAVTGSTTDNGAPKTLTAEQIDAALAVFGDSIVTADRTNNTLKVDYNFGIVAITPSYDATGTVTMFTVTVAVKTSDGNAATLAEGAMIELVDNDTKATLRAAAPFDANGSGGYDGYFYATSTDDYDSPIGRSFKVKATK